MNTVMQVVKSYLTMTQLRQHLYHDWKLDEMCDLYRGAVWQDCLRLGIDASQDTIVTTILRVAVDLDDELVDGDAVLERTRLTISPENEAELVAMTPRRVSRWVNHSTSDIAIAAADQVEAVEWIIDPEIDDTLMQVYEAIGEVDMVARDKRIPLRTVKELEAIGSSTFRVRFSTFDKADRIYADTKGVIASMWEKDSRARNVMPYSRKTDLGAHERYMERLGLDQSLAAEIIADPVTYILNGGSPLKYAQVVSWHRIASTGETNILVEGDAANSGAVHQLLMMRDTEVFRRALPFRKDFESYSTTVAKALRRNLRSLKVFTIEELVSVGKDFQVAGIYGAGVKGFFSSKAKVRAPEDLIRDGKFKEIELNPVIDTMIGNPTPEDIEDGVDWNGVRARLFFAFCQQGAIVFRKAVPKAQTFIKFWMNEWKENSTPEGLWIERCDGTQILCPRLKRDKYNKSHYALQEWIPGASKPVTVATANIFSPHMDDAGTAASAFVAHNRDAYSMATAIVLSKGGIKASIHDATLFFLADEVNVQRSYVRGINEAHRLDLMNTGLPQILLPEDEFALGY